MENLTEKILSKFVRTSYGYIQPYQMKLIEGYIESSLQFARYDVAYLLSIEVTMIKI